MSIIHIVLFSFKPNVPPATVQDVCRRMLALKDECMHPVNGKPYIKTSTGGQDNSIEDLQHGITHGFVVEFENEHDRYYYVKKDPAHSAFVEILLKVTEKIQVVDYAPGVY